MAARWKPAPGVWTFSSRELLQPRKAFAGHLPDGRTENSPSIHGWDCVSEYASPEGTAESLPPIPLVVLDFVFLEQRGEFLLKGLFAVMLCLAVKADEGHWGDSTVPAGLIHSPMRTRQ